MSFRLRSLLLFTSLVALSLASWITWRGMVGYYAGQPPFRLPLAGAIHFFLLFAAPTAVIGCLFGKAGHGFLIGSAIALAWYITLT